MCGYCDSDSFVSGPSHGFYCPRYKCRPCWQKDRECAHAERDRAKATAKLVHH